MNNKYIKIIFTIILSFLFTLSITWNSYGSFDLLSFICMFIVFGFIFYLIWDKLDLIKIKLKDNIVEKREFIVYTAIILLPLVVGFLAYYPGYYTYDTINQWNQVQSGVYNNWHPVVETLFMFKLPSLFFNSIVSATVFQCLLIYLILIYFCYFCRSKFLNFKQTSIMLLLITFNPLFIKHSVTLWKDIIFSWSIFLATLCLINISVDELWIKKFKNKLLFILSILGVLFFRHNGIAAFCLMFVCLFIFYHKDIKFFLITFITILVCNSILVGPVYDHFNINSKTGGRTEMIGVVMGQISYYYKNGAYFTDDEIKVLNDVVPIEKLDKYYNPRNFNSIKWQLPNFSQSADKNFDKIIKLYINKSAQNPKMFVKSFLNMSSPIWETRLKLALVDETYTEYDTSLMDKGCFYDTSEYIYAKLITYNNNITNSPLRWLFTNIGQGLFLTLFCIAIVIKRSKFSLKKLVPFILVISNSLIMMLLITGEEYRFVYYQSICVIPLLIYSFSSYIYKKDKKSNSKVSKLYRKLFIQKTNNTIIQFIRYIFVGGVAAVVNIGMLYIFTEIFSIYYLISNVLSFTLGLIVNYLLSKKFVFQDSTSISKQNEFLVYTIIGVIGLVLDTLFVGLFTNIFGMYYMISKIISTVLVFVWNFLARKLFYKIVK